MDAWPVAADVEARLKSEAEALAKQLGHKMTSWVKVSHGLRARCVTCRVAVDLSPRSAARAPMRGEAVTFPCR